MENSFSLMGYTVRESISTHAYLYLPTNKTVNFERMKLVLKYLFNIVPLTLILSNAFTTSADDGYNSIYGL